MPNCGALPCTAAWESRKEPGLGDVLNGQCEAGEAAVTTENIPHLSVVSSGAAVTYPAEALASDVMVEVLRRWRNEYDYVVIDTPPVAMVTDAVVLAAQADAVVLVAMATETTRQALLRTRDRLQRANARIAGVVVNGVDSRYENSYYRAYGKHRSDRSYDPNFNAWGLRGCMGAAVVCGLAFAVWSVWGGGIIPMEAQAQTATSCNRSHGGAPAMRLDAGHLLEISTFDTPELSGKFSGQPWRSHDADWGRDAD